MPIPSAGDAPSDHRANIAIGLAPIFVAVVFVLIVSGMVAFDTGVAIVLACTAWVVYEMRVYQRAVDAYQQQWLQAAPVGLAEAPQAPEGKPPRTLVSARGTLQFEPSRL